MGGLCCECGSVSRPKEAQRSVVVRNLVQAIDSFYHFPIPAQQEASIEPDESTPTSFIESLPDSLVISKFLQISQSEAEKDLTKESPISQVLLSPSKTKRAIINSNVENGSQPQLPSHTQEESGQPSTMKIVGRSQKRKLHYADQENTFINDALEYSLFDHGPPSPTQSQIQPSHSQSEMEEFSQQQQQQSPPSPQLVERIISSQKTNHSDHIAFTSSFQSTPSVSISSNGANVTQLNISQPIATSYSGGVPPTITQSGSWVGAQVEVSNHLHALYWYISKNKFKLSSRLKMPSSKSRSF